MSDGAQADKPEGEITIEEAATRGRYVWRTPDLPEAEMTFSKLGEDALIIDHTGVPDALRGLGVGVRLVSRAVADARASGRKLLPLCPFAAAQFRRHPEWADVLRR
jgi:uncharacterized protein